MMDEWNWWDELDGDEVRRNAWGWPHYDVDAVAEVAGHRDPRRASGSFWVISSRAVAMRAEDEATLSRALLMVSRRDIRT